MKIVVDVPERDFGIYYRMVDEGMANEAVRRIVKGTLLPKGHGRLIDADAIEYDEESLETDSSQVFLVVDKDSIDLMPTIVEADKEDDT